MTSEQAQIPFSAVRSLGNGRVLVLAPHPDDEVFGCAGAILRHVADGDPVRVAVVTDGAIQAPPENGTATTEPTRHTESRNAARLLGYGEPEFWNLPDRGLVYGEPLVRRITAAIDTFDAELIYAPSPTEIHPDHRALGLAAIEAVRRSTRDRMLVLYEVAIPLTPNRLLDITDLVERKHEAMHCFPSQLVHQDYSRHVAALNAYRSFTLPPEILAAEAYHVIPASTLRERIVDPTGPFYQRPLPRGPGEDMAQPPLVSVIVRSVGRPQLREALDSVALQTYPHIEVVVVNAKGKGHPAVGDLCGAFPLHLVDSDEPLPRSRAANAGLQRATGDYCIFLDDDDIYYPDHVAGLVETIVSSGARVAYAGIAVEHYQDGQRIGSGEFNHPFDPGRLKAGNFIPMHAALFSRWFLEQGCRFDESLDRYEDWDFWLQLASYGPFLHRPRLSACYRSHGSSGFGLQPDERIVRDHKTRLLEKWRQRWSGDDLYEIFALFESSQSLTRENAQLRQQLEGQVSAVHRQESALTAQQAQHKQEMQAAAGALAKSREQEAFWRSQAASLTAELERMTASNSWRLTHPLRWLRTRVRGSGKTGP